MMSGTLDNEILWETPAAKLVLISSGLVAAVGLQPVLLGYRCYDGAADSGYVRGKYLFRFDDAILLGCCSGARTTTASLGMINDRAKSQIPGLGYTITYAVGNTLLTIWGMVLVMLLT
jgi:uncharacterized transporter YbjL